VLFKVDDAVLDKTVEVLRENNIVALPATEVYAL